jgi:hypothetical protein
MGDLRSLRTELQMIRDRVNGLLDRMESVPATGASKDSIVPDGESTFFLYSSFFCDTEQVSAKL